jgi:hypothetical protein
LTYFFDRYGLPGRAKREPQGDRYSPKERQKKEKKKKRKKRKKDEKKRTTTIEMSNTRIGNDRGRIQYNLQVSTGPVRHTIDTPGVSDPMYIADPFIRAQRFGGNLYTDAIDASTSLRNGLPARPTEFSIAEWMRTPVPAPIHFPEDDRVFTENSRATEPAFALRGTVMDRTPHFPLYDPTVQYETPFLCEVFTRQDRF